MSTPINIAVFDNFCTAGLSDSQTASQPYAISFSDALSFSDSSNPFGLLQFGDSVVLSDLIGILGACSFDQEGDGLSLSDSIVDTLGLDVISGDATDVESLSDNLDAVIVGIVETFTDTITLSDSISLPGPTVALSLTDSVSLTDGNIVVQGIQSTFQESLTLSDTLATAAPNSVSVGDSTDVISLSDAITVDEGTGALSIFMQDTLNLSDSEIVQLGLDFSLSGDTLALSDLEKALETGILTPADELVLSDLLQIDSPITGPGLTDSLLFTEYVRIEFELMVGGPPDQLPFADSISVSLVVIDPQVSDTLALSDSFIYNLSQLQNESLSDSLALSDSILVVREPLPESVSDSLSLSDSISLYNAADLPYTFSDSLVLSDGAEEVVYTDFIDYLRRYLNDVPN